VPDKPSLPITLLLCPRCQSPLEEATSGLGCAGCHAHYPLSRGRPVLLAPDHPLFPQAAYEQATSHTAPRRASLVPSVNLSAERCILDIAARLDERPDTRVLLLGSGGQRARLSTQMRSSVVAVDIDVNAEVDVFADALSLPFRDESFDAVIATAVLEHVIRPETAVEEICRVLKPSGLLYSEIPFMQQVHEGAYDFTRYTLSGHRRLAARFEELDSGAVAGPAIALRWSIEHFFLAVVSERPLMRKLVKGGVRTTFAWLAIVDRRIAQRPAALDGASCTYFYGRLRENTATDKDIIAGYRGAQRLRHV
jgi:SAM-dependent methyltransferase